MGEFIAVAKEDARSSSLQAYKDGSSQFTNKSKFDKEVDAEAKALNMPGMETVYNWNQSHPGSDRDTYGAVVVWSVKRALAANKLSDELKEAGGAAGGIGIGDKRAPANPPKVTADEAEKKKKKGTNGGTNGGGAEGETP
jgi:heme-degrading monooxygenase HmoA